MSNFTYPWKVQDGDSERHYQLAIPAGAQKLVISFEYSAPELPGQITSIMGLRWSALRKRHQLLVGYQINKPNSRRNIDDGKGGLHGGRLRAWAGGSRYQAEISVDLQKGGFTFVEAGDQIAGSISAFPVPAIPGAAVTPATLDLSFGQTGIADGAYYPPLGFTFYEVSVMLDGVPIVAEPGPDAGTIPPPPPVVVAPPPPPPVVVAPPPPPPPTPAPQPVPAPAPQGGPDVAGIEAAIASIYGAHGNLGIGVILGLLGRYLPSPWNALVPLLVTELTKGGA